MRARNLSVILVAAALAAGAALASSGKTAGTRNAPAKSAKGPAQNGCATCIERRVVLDPKLFADTRIYEAEVPRAYEVARKYPATLDRLHCFCECQESPKFEHKTLLTCFTDEHAAGCGICIKEALVAAELKGRGASDAEIETLVEGSFKTDGHAPTHDHHR
ncbi:MAG: CYCXC family (seleno)protein [Thermoanaerobaculia bacterium]